MAEALALREAIQCCIHNRLELVRFEADSAQLIKALNSGGDIPELYGVVSDILSLASMFKSACFVWIPRERNSFADTLAKEVLLVGGQSMVESTFIPLN